MSFRYFILCLSLLDVSNQTDGLLYASTGLSQGYTQDATQDVPELRSETLGSTRNVHAVGDIYLSGRFAPEDIEIIKEKGILRVISLCTDGELPWDEKEVVEAAGLEFLSIPFGGADTLTPEIFDLIREQLDDADGPILLHCQSANRVGGVWLPFRTLDQSVPLEQAQREAAEVGLRTEAYEAKALEYIQSQLNGSDGDRTESVNPGINASFLDPELNVDQYVERFEGESREVFALRNELVEQCGELGGKRVADVGAGTGLFSRIFSREVGADGWVFAVDISPKFIEHINDSSMQIGLENISAVLCTENSVRLPPNSVDLVFICDTYHHFEYPQQTLETIRQALRDDGTLVLIDFERIPGETREFLMNHVRAGKEVFQQEILDAGFELDEEIEVEGLEENYFLKFRKN